MSCSAPSVSSNNAIHFPSSAMLLNSNDAEAILRPFDPEEREALLDRVMERLDDAEDEPQTRSCPRS